MPYHGDFSMILLIFIFSMLSLFAFMVFVCCVFAVFSFVFFVVFLFFFLVFSLFFFELGCRQGGRGVEKWRFFLCSGTYSISLVFSLGFLGCFFVVFLFFSGFFVVFFRARVSAGGRGANLGAFRWFSGPMVFFFCDGWCFCLFFVCFFLGKS